MRKNGPFSRRAAATLLAMGMLLTAAAGCGQTPADTSSQDVSSQAASQMPALPEIAYGERLAGGVWDLSALLALPGYTFETAKFFDDYRVLAAYSNADGVAAALVNLVTGEQEALVEQAVPLEAPQITILTEYSFALTSADQNKAVIFDTAFRPTVFTPARTVDDLVVCTKDYVLYTAQGSLYMAQNSGENETLLTDFGGAYSRAELLYFSQEGIAGLRGEPKDGGETQLIRFDMGDNSFQSLPAAGVREGALDGETFYYQSDGALGALQRYDSLEGAFLEPFALQGVDERLETVKNGVALTVGGTAGDAARLAFYDAEAGTLLGEYGDFPDLLLQEGRQSDLSNDARFCLIWGEAETEEKMLLLCPEEMETTPAASQQASVVERLEAAYGVRVKTGEDAMTAFPDFTAEPLTVEAAVTLSLQEVEAVLAKFPEGFFEELLAGELPRLTVHIAGALTQRAAGGTSSPEAFTYVDYEAGERHIVLDGRSPDSILTNLPHELMHAIDEVILLRTGASYFADWPQYQPAGFRYAQNYVGADGGDYADPAYTPADPRAQQDPNCVYFVDAYSKTFDTEDRARLFETLFTGDPAAHGERLPSYFAESMHLRDKASYLCNEIRACFPSVQRVELAYWERLLVDEK